MTTQLLPSIIASPFSSHFDAKPIIFSGSDSTYSGIPAASTSLTPFFAHQNHQISSASAFSVASAPAFASNENQDPLGARNGLSNSFRSVSAPFNPKRSTEHRQSSSYPGQCAASDRPLSTYRSNTAHCANDSPEKLSYAPTRGHQPLVELQDEEGLTPQVYRRIKATSPDPGRLETTLSRGASFTAERAPGGSTQPSNEEPEPWLDSLFSPGQALCHQEPPSPLQKESEEEPGSPRLQFDGHRKRLSTASSGFVHTMKTASLSNASFSIVPRSLRIGRSTTSYGMSGSHTRCSMESDRPPTSSSMDEAAFRRGLKRRQILGELITTEESYIADLKALIYLYSTLLASTLTVSSQMRASILRNVHDLLHTHERLLERLHQAAYEAAVRKWADTTSPRDLGSPHRHRRWRSLESNVAVKFSRSQRRTRYSVDSAEVNRGRTYLGCAEPRDVADVAAIFRDFLSDFLTYEEYCANHSLIAHELQKHAPTIWSTYESGIESLAKTLVALDHKRHNERKGLTVGDLLIKPIQRVTRYPLLFDDLLRQTPVADCPSAHFELEATLKNLREVVQSVNQATDNRETQLQVQRRWSLQSMLTYEKVSLKAEEFRKLGNIRLCGVLHVAWQTRNKIDGCYALCILFDGSLVVAFPAGASSHFEVIAFLHLPELKVECASDGRGLQCHSTLHTWKVCFEVGGHLHEFILSACSAIEEDAWRNSMQGRGTYERKTDELVNQIPSSIGLDLRSVGVVYGQQSSTLSRHPSVQRAATVGNRAPICQVIIRNTNNPHDLHEFRQPCSSAINRSQSHMTSNRIVVLSPKRSERARLELAVGDVWTKDKLPYPGMIGSRGYEMIRASAGTLVRKFSLASIHAPFSRRSGSLSLANRRSYEAFTEGRRSRCKYSVPVFEVRKESFEDSTPAKQKPHDLPELDTMDNVVSRMIGGHGTKRLSFSHGEHSLLRRVTKSKRSGQARVPKVGPGDPAEIFYGEEKETGETGEMGEKQETIEEGLTGKKKRWSNPLGILKGLSAESLRNILYSSK